jgi:hypothetical protein
MKRDSSAAFYRSQFPDSAMALPEIYRQYISGDKYDNYPVVGVSWDNAMNYLRWRTINANKDRIYDTIYRLPVLSEWIAAYNYFQTTKTLKEEMSGDFSDWTLNLKDESTFDINLKYGYLDAENIYYALPSDPPVLKRKIAVGSSFHYGQLHLSEFQSYYEFHGYAHISFRYVIEVRTLEQRMAKKSSLLKLWGLEQ